MHARWTVVALAPLVLLAATAGGVPRGMSGQIAEIAIAILGDSYASGEGNPPYFDQAGCHRSTQSGHWQAAERVRASTTKVVKAGFFACTGASVRAGLLGPQSGRDSQLDQLEQWMQDANVATINVLTLSIGGNDAQFKEIVDTCLVRPLGDCATDESLTAAVSAGLSSIERDLATFHQRLITRRLGVENVIVTRYPNAVRNAAGVCPTGLYTEVLPREVSAANLVYADAFVTHLNGALSASILRINRSRSDGDPMWTVADSHLQPFASHSLCDRQPWYRSFWDSIKLQGDWDGVLHPTSDGQDAIRDAILGPMSRMLVHVGDPGGDIDRRHRRWAQFTGDWVSCLVRADHAQEANQRIGLARAGRINTDGVGPTVARAVPGALPRPVPARQRDGRRSGL